MRTLLYGGRVIDPANGVDGTLHLLLEDGKVAAVSARPMPADETIDVRGKVVCPGFIDCHVHEDSLEKDGRLYADPVRSVFSCMARMGVATVVAGNCGDNVCDPADYLDAVDRQGAAVNVAMLAGHSFFRSQAGAADPYAPASPQQTAAAAQGMARALEQGCAGISYGIRYAPGTTARELLDTAQVCVPAGKIAACHLRDDAAAVFDALDEFLSVTTALGIPAQISHIGSMAGFGQMERFLDRICLGRLQGADVQCDCYPYSAFSTGLGSATYDDGWLERYGCGYDVLELCEGAYKGQRCTEQIFRQVRREFPQCRTVCHVMIPEQVAMALAHPSVMLASDATMHLGQGHPRAAGTFPRLIAEYVRPGKMGLYDAVAKMTAMPAARFRLAGKGRLNVGADGDVTVFDPMTIRDRATFDDPIAPPEGVAYVFIGGRMAVRDGSLLSPALGRAVRV